MLVKNQKQKNPFFGFFEGIDYKKGEKILIWFFNKNIYFASTLILEINKVVKIYCDIIYVKNNQWIFSGNFTKLKASGFVKIVFYIKILKSYVLKHNDYVKLSILCKLSKFSQK